MLLAVALGIADWIVLIVYLLGIVTIGVWFGKFTHTMGLNVFIEAAAAAG